MEEDEAIRRTKNSIKRGKSHAEIVKGFLRRGYTLEYAEAIMKKASRPKKILTSFIILFLLFVSVSSLTFNFILVNEKQDLINPLTGYGGIAANYLGQAMVSSEEFLNLIANELNLSEEEKQDLRERLEENETLQFYNNSINYTNDEIEITPEFITFILNEIGAYKLHKNPLTFDNPKINFKIDNESFNSVVTDEIKTTTGLSDDPDIEFVTTKESIIEVMKSSNPETSVKEKIATEEFKLNLIANDAELFAKGYNTLYEDLKQEKGYH